MPSISAISAVATGVGRAADGGRGVQRLGQLERRHGGGVVHDAGDVGGQVHDVGQVQHERRLGHVHRGAVRLEGVGDRADGVLVLLEVLRRPGQGGGQGEVALVVAGTPDGAGQHPRGDQAALAAHQHLGGRAEHAVDVEGPAHRVGLGEPAQRPADVDRLVGGGDQVAGQHDLLEVAAADPGDGVGDDRHPLLAVEGAVGEAHADRRGRARSAGSSDGRRRRRRPMVSQATSPRRPTTTCGARPARSRRARRRRRRSRRRPGPVPGSLTSSRTTARAVDLAPPLVGVGEPGRAVGAHLGGDAPADQAVAAAQPGDRAVGGDQVEESRRPPPRSRRDGADGRASRAETYSRTRRIPRLGRASSVGGREHPHNRRPHPDLGRRSSSVSLLLGLMAAFAIGLPKAQRRRGRPSPRRSTLTLPDTLPGGYVASDDPAAFADGELADQADEIAEAGAGQPRRTATTVLPDVLGTAAATRTYVADGTEAVFVQAFQSEGGAFAPNSIPDPANTGGQAGHRDGRGRRRRLHPHLRPGAGRRARRRRWRSASARSRRAR